jgi:hypothetical protein
MTEPEPGPSICTHETGWGGAVTERNPPRRRDRSAAGVDADEPQVGTEPGDEAPDLLERVAEVVADLFDDETGAETDADA